MNNQTDYSVFCYYICLLSTIMLYIHYFKEKQLQLSLFVSECVFTFMHIFAYIIFIYFNNFNLFFSWLVIICKTKYSYPHKKQIMTGWEEIYFQKSTFNFINVFCFVCFKNLQVPKTNKKQLSCHCTF